MDILGIIVALKPAFEHCIDIYEETTKGDQIFKLQKWDTIWQFVISEADQWSFPKLNGKAVSSHPTIYQYIIIGLCIVTEIHMVQRYRFWSKMLRLGHHIGQKL